MNREDDIKKELKEISPFLADLKKENPFEVPFGYFDRMQEEVLEKSGVKQSAPAPEPSMSWLDQILASLAFMLRPQVALSALGLALAVWGGIYLTQENTSAEVLASQDEIEIEEANAYIAAHIDEFDDELLMELVASQEGNSETIFPETSEEDEFMNDVLDELEGVDIEDLL